VTIAHHLSIAQKRTTLALALAHRALGHWGRTLEQDVEARRLAAQWLLPEREIAHAVQAVGIDPWAMAEHLSVTRGILLVKFGMVCDHQTNLALFRGLTCGGCAYRAAA
jgi:hypothetical protein